jgi:hypothetical protein
LADALHSQLTSSGEEKGRYTVPTLAPPRGSVEEKSKSRGGGVFDDTLDQISEVDPYRFSGGTREEILSKGAPTKASASIK